MFPIYRVYVRKDSNTITPTTVTAHEIVILKKLFGDEYVQNKSGERIESLGKAIGKFNPPEDEYARLCAKYSQEVVDACYKKIEIEQLVKQNTVS